MTKISRKLLLSVFTLVLTVVALGTTTFAWFALSENAYVNEFNVDISGTTGLDMRVTDHLGQNASSWKTAVLPADIYQIIGQDQNAPVLKDVTTTDGKTFKYLGTGTPTRNTDYVEFTIEFRSTEFTKVNWANIELAAPDKPFAVDVNFTDQFGNPVQDGQDTVDTNAIYASRVAIVDQGLNVEAAAVVAPRIHEIRAIGDTNINVSGATNTNIPMNGAISYYVAKNSVVPGGSGPLQTDLPAFTLPTTYDYSTAGIATAADERLIVNLAKALPADPYYQGKVVVRIWLEGWDPDTYNSILTLPGQAIKDKFYASFVFAGGKD